MATWACSGRPFPSPIGTIAGTDPPTSTWTTEPTSVAQTHTGGRAPPCPGHQAAAWTPTRLGERTRSVTTSATRGLEPATDAARAPARAADLAAKDSAPHTASSTQPRASNSVTGHARANSRIAAPRRPRGYLNAGSSGEPKRRGTSRLLETAERLRPPRGAARFSAPSRPHRTTPLPLLPPGPGPVP